MFRSTNTSFLLPAGPPLAAFGNEELDGTIDTICLEVVREEEGKDSDGDDHEETVKVERGVRLGEDEREAGGEAYASKTCTR